MNRTEQSSITNELKRLCLEYNIVQSVAGVESMLSMLRWILMINDIQSDNIVLDGNSLLRKMIAINSKENLLDSLQKQFAIVISPQLIDCKKCPKQYFESLINEYQDFLTELQPKERLDLESLCRETLEYLLKLPRHRLAVYGSLAPGQQNHWVVKHISGNWQQGKIYGHLHQRGWGALDGFPAMSFDEKGSEIPAYVLTSDALSLHWARIDEFEGNEYQRILVPVVISKKLVVGCNVYALRED